MASQKQIFMVALLFTIAFGCDASKICRVMKDCPPCKSGEPLCADGQCSCEKKKMQVDDVAINAKKECGVSKECPKCKLGVSVCVDGICICTETTTQDEDIGIAPPAPAPACKAREDCPPCPIGVLPLCIKAKCVCL